MATTSQSRGKRRVVYADRLWLAAWALLLLATDVYIVWSWVRPQ